MCHVNASYDVSRGQGQQGQPPPDATLKRQLRRVPRTRTTRTTTTRRHVNVSYNASHIDEDDNASHVDEDNKDDNACHINNEDEDGMYHIDDDKGGMLC